MAYHSFTFTNNPPDEQNHFAGPGAGAADVLVADVGDAIFTFTTPHAGRLVPAGSGADMEADLGAAENVSAANWPRLIPEGTLVVIRQLFGVANAGQLVRTVAQFFGATGFEPAGIAPAGTIPNPRVHVFSTTPPEAPA